MLDEQVPQLDDPSHGNGIEELKPGKVELDVEHAGRGDLRDGRLKRGLSIGSVPDTKPFDGISPICSNFAPIR